MDWYCVLTDHLLNNVNEDNIANGGGSPKSVRKQLEQRVVELYKAILMYQMKSVCSYYWNQYKEFFLDLVDLKDWDGARTNVENAEKTLKEDWEQHRKVQAMDLWGNLVKLTEKSQILLVGIGQTLKDVIALQEVMRMDDENQKCLHDLRVVSPQDDMVRIEQEKEELLDDAHEWIFEDKKYAAFTNWDESHLPPCRLLWVNGGAGTGKTMLLIGIIRKLSFQSAVFAPTLSYFFCQSQGKTDLPLNNATATLRSLIWMLLIQQQDLIKHLQTDYKHSGRNIFTDMNAPFAMRRVFEKMLKDARPVYFIVDALDECDEGLEDLIKLISTSLALSDKVRWLVSSRPEVDILTKLKNPDSKNPAIAETLVELDMQGQRGRVEKYIKHKLSDLKRSRFGYSYTNEILATVLHEVSERAEDNLLWMSLVFKDLKTMRGQSAVKKIKDYPHSLSRLYDHKMTRIENAETKHSQHCRDVLVATSLAYRPLSLSELAVLVPWSEEIDPCTIVEECESFLTIREETVSLIHKSAKDYLEANYTSRLQHVGAVQGHADISRRSINAMSQLTKNIYALPHPGSESKDITVPSPDPLEGLQYSCVYWVRHVCQVYSQLDLYQSIKKPQENAFDLHDNGHVHRFLEEHFHHWLEAVSLMRKTSLCVLMIIQLENLIVSEACHYAIFADANKVGQPKPSELYNLVFDAKRFLLKFRSVIEMTPFQIYNSALLFSPQASIIRNLFQKEIDWVRISSGVEQNWSPALQTLEGHSSSVNSVVFSHDGSKLASGSDDHTIRVWDVATGQVEHTLEGHSDSVNSVVFSHDGSKLASGLLDYTVRVWDVATGQVEHVLEGHSSWVNSIVFSPDGSKLASGSFDCTVRVWDIATGQVEHVLKGHSSSVESVLFSPDGSKLALESHAHNDNTDDRTVRVWDVVTGEVEHVLDGATIHHRVQSRSIYSVDNSGYWVTQNGLRILNLPVDHRPGWTHCMAAEGSNLAIGSPAGRVTIITFCSNIKT
jgi:N-terminal domain of NWD NACHT-NTPase/NACHT domain/WD domain, G-beta repeat